MQIGGLGGLDRSHCQCPLDIKKGIFIRVKRHGPKTLSGCFAGTLERGAGRSRRPSCLSVEGAGGAKVPFLNAMICFLIANMIHRR